MASSSGPVIFVDVRRNTELVVTAALHRPGHEHFALQLSAVAASRRRRRDDLRRTADGRRSVEAGRRGRRRRSALGLDVHPGGRRIRRYLESRGTVGAARWTPREADALTERRHADASVSGGRRQPRIAVLERLEVEVFAVVGRRKPVVSVAEVTTGARRLRRLY